MLPFCFVFQHYEFGAKYFPFFHFSRLRFLLEAQNILSWTQLFWKIAKEWNLHVYKKDWNNCNKLSFNWKEFCASEKITKL